MAVKFLEKLRSFFRYFDRCSVSFSFKYMDEDKYTTSLGGLISISFFIIGCIIFVINFIPFKNDQNFTLQHYIINTDKTEEIKLNVSPMAFAIGFDCPADSRTNIKGEDLFDLKVSFITYIKDKGNRTKVPKEIKIHNCNKNDFHNEHNNSFDLLEINNLYCLDKNATNGTKLEGIYTDEKFTYYEFSLIAKKDTAEHYKTIHDYLIGNDCKLQFYYTDLTLNLSNYNEPIKSYINSLFLQIKPDLFLKMNIFFMNYHLIDNKAYIEIINKEKEPVLKTGFSRAEQYSLDKGTDRFSTKPYNYNKYANLYIRVDNKKLEIKRKYQNLLEFYADNSSLLISIFTLFNFVISIYNTFKSNLSISRRLFFNEKEQEKEHRKIKLLIKKDKEKYKDNNITNNINNSINENSNYCDTRDEQHIEHEENQESLENKKFSNKYSFSSIYYCCKPKIKKWFSQANMILDNRLDIFFYIRKMILLEIIIGDYFDKNQKEINYKSRIFQYIDYNVDKNLECYYKWSDELKTDKYLNDFEKKQNENIGNGNIENIMITYRRNHI